MEKNQNQSTGPELQIVKESDRSLCKIGQWELSFWNDTNDGEPRIRDEDAGVRLGFIRPRKVRELIERIWPENMRPKCRPNSKIQLVGRNSRAVRQYTVNEYWLTEAQLLKVIARCRTPIAESILDEMITVYMRARRGLGPLPAPPQPQPLPPPKPVSRVKPPSLDQFRIEGLRKTWNMMGQLLEGLDGKPSEELRDPPSHSDLVVSAGKYMAPPGAMIEVRADGSTRVLPDCMRELRSFVARSQDDTLLHHFAYIENDREDRPAESYHHWGRVAIRLSEISRSSLKNADDILPPLDEKSSLGRPRPYPWEHSVAREASRLAMKCLSWSQRFTGNLQTR